MAQVTKINPAGKPRATRGRSNPVDAHVGSRVRQRRTLLGLSQEKLGDALGLTFQQVQKYERGANRIGASRLYQLSSVLDVPVSFFFDDMPPEVAKTGGRRPFGFSASEAAVYEVDTLAKRETLELVRAYYRIKNEKVRKRVFELAKALAKADEKS